MSDPDEVVVPIKADLDVVFARQKVRGMVSGLRFSASELMLIATAISEVARNIVSYAGSGESLNRPSAGCVLRAAGPAMSPLLSSNAVYRSSFCDKMLIISTAREDERSLAGGRHECAPGFPFGSDTGSSRCHARFRAIGCACGWVSQ